MKLIHRKPSANFSQTPTWGITATKYAVVIAFGLHDVVIELPRRKLTPHAPDGATSHDNGLCEHGAVLCTICHLGKSPRR